MALAGLCCTDRASLNDSLAEDWVSLLSLVSSAGLATALWGRISNLRYKHLRAVKVVV